jgi:hypothetical protein
VPLSNPLVIDAAAEFIPVAIYNNVKGKDAEVLKRFGEPAWNNPVVRFVNADGNDLIPRKDGVYATGPLVGRMVAALKAAKRTVPAWLELVAFEMSPQKPERATFAMFCYWTGEKELGRLEGVLGTGIGHLGRYEVVEVLYDAAVVDYRRLVEQANKAKCAGRVFARTDQQAEMAKAVVGAEQVERSDEATKHILPQYHLQQAPHYYFAPLTPLQATKANVAIADRKSPDSSLSPSQLAFKDRMQKLLSNQGQAKAVVERLQVLRPERCRYNRQESAADYTQRLDALLRELEAPPRGKAQGKP